MVSTAHNFRIGKSTTSAIIKETCNILWDVLKPIVLPIPTKEFWLDTARKFESKWNFPHCLGAIDGKHVVIQAPAHSGSTFYNYKGTHSIVLMAAYNANYQFIMVDIGAQSRQSDGGVFKCSQMGIAFEEGLLDIPQPSEMFPGGPKFPYVLVADDAFQLSNYLMKPYPTLSNQFYKRIFNYRLSRARRTIENAFGILAARWRIFRKPIISSLETAEAIVKASVCLHNFLLEENAQNEQSTYCPRGYVDEEPYGGLILGEWRNEGNPGALRNLDIRNQHAYTASASTTREEFAEYFMTDGSVDFQWQKALQ